MQAVPPINWTLETIKIVVPAILGFLFGIGLEKYRRRQTRNVRAAAYLETIAGALEGMAESFANAKIPHADGHLLEALIEAFDDTTRHLVDDDLIPTLKKLHAMAAKAEEIDRGLLRVGPIQGRQAVQPFIDDARRISGDLKGRAAILSAQ